MIYNQPDPYLPDFLMCRAELADVLLDGDLVGVCDGAGNVIGPRRCRSRARTIGGRSERTP